MSEHAECLALEISTHTTSIFRCDGDVPKECVGSVYTDDPEFDHKLAQIAAQTKSEVRRKVPTQIWMADDQIILRHVRLNSSGSVDRREEAASAMSAITPFKPEDLCFTLGEEDGEGYTPVAAVPNKIVDEAAALARSIGFQTTEMMPTDDIEGFVRRPVWQSGPAMEPSRSRVMQVACFAVAIALPFVMAGAANNTDFATQVRAFLAFTPNNTADSAVTEIQTAAAVIPDQDMVVAAAPTSDAAAPRLTSRAKAAAGAPGYVQRYVRAPIHPRFEEPAAFVQPAALQSLADRAALPVLDVVAMPAVPAIASHGVSSDATDGPELELHNIDFLVARDGYAEPRGFAGIRTANLDADFLTTMPRSRKVVKVIPPRVSALPKSRPRPALPEETYNETHLPSLNSPTESAIETVLPGLVSNVERHIRPNAFPDHHSGRCGRIIAGCVRGTQGRSDSACGEVQACTRIAAAPPGEKAGGPGTRRIRQFGSGSCGEPEPDRRNAGGC